MRFLSILILGCAMMVMKEVGANTEETAAADGEVIHLPWKKSQGYALDNNKDSGPGVNGSDLVTFSSLTRSNKKLVCCSGPDIKTCLPVQINAAMLGGSITLPGGWKYSFKDNIDSNPNAYNYEDDQGSELDIYYNSKTNRMNGHAMTSDGRSFVIESCGSQGHVYKEIDLTNIKESEGIDDEIVQNSTRRRAGKIRISSDKTTIVTYSVMIYYTKAFADITPDIEGFTDILISETNQGYINSKVPLRVKRHCLEQVLIPDGLDAGVTLKKLKTMRSSYEEILQSADAAILLVKSLKDAGGIGYLNAVSYGGAMFSVTQKSYAQGYYTFGHELGHNIGLMHNIEEGRNNYYSYGHGSYIDKGNTPINFRTIMAYSKKGYGKRTNYYSNPLVKHEKTGTATGATNADNARVLTENRFMLADIGDESKSCKIPSLGCYGDSKDWSCCSSSNQCGLGKGDCDSDSDCYQGLKCGRDNCRAFNPLAHYAADCCTDAADCTSGSTDWSCCSSSDQCGEGAGDCDSDADCKGDLVCGKKNCKAFNPLASSEADCCVPKS